MICKFGNGDILSTFNVEDSLNDITSMFDSVDEALAINDPESPKYIDPTKVSKAIADEKVQIL